MHNHISKNAAAYCLKEAVFADGVFKSYLQVPNTFLSGTYLEFKLLLSEAWKTAALGLVSVILFSSVGIRWV